MQRDCTLKLNVFLLLTLFIFLLNPYSLPLSATVRYVSKTGSSIPPYITWETAADSIQKCINVSVFGDTIYVANGVYEEQVVMISGLSLIGAGTDSCFIDTRDLVTSQTYRSVTVADSCLFTGFHIIVYFNSDWGYGMDIIGKSLVTYNMISNARRGILNSSNAIIGHNILNNVSIGIRLSYSNAVVKQNIISTDPNTQAPLVNGIYIDGNTSNFKPVIDSNYIEANNRANGIYKAPGTRSTITNNEIKLVNGATGIFLHSYLSDSAWVYNNLIYAEAGIQGIENGVPNLQLYNNYATGNFDDQQNIRFVLRIGSYNKVKNNIVTNSERGVEVWGTQGLDFKYNDVWNNDVNYSGFTPDTTNLFVDPMVVNDDSTQGKLDFHLQKYSPLIDTGDPNILDIDGTRSDIGLFGGPYGESYVYIDLAPRSPVNLAASVDSNIVSLNWNKNTEADFSYYKLFYDTTKNFQIDTTKLVTSQPDTFYYFVIPTESESLYFKITAVDNQGNESNPSEEVGVLITSVEDEWKPLNNYILYQNYPNPFNPSTKIGYKMKERGYVKLYVYDVKGELVSVLVNQRQEAGYYEVDFSVGQSASGGIPVLSSGVYIYQILVSNDRSIPVFSDIKKMVYIK